MLFGRRDNVKRTTIEAERQARKQRNFRRLVRLMYASILLAAFAGMVELRRFLLTTDLLALRTIEHVGNDKATGWEINTLGKLEPGQNVLGLDLKEVAKQIRRHPWVAEVRIRRILPDRLQIEIKEREPVALVSVGELYYVDREGTIFKKVKPGEHLGYPVLTGFDEPGPLQRGRIGRQAIREALALLEQVSAKTNFRSEQISEIHLDPDLGFSIYTAHAGAQIHLGWDNFERKLERLVRLLNHERLDLAQVRRIDMDLSKAAVVTPL